jgi:hypothetical protein
MSQLPQYGLGYSGMGMINPTMAAIVGGVQTAGAASRGVANQMTKGQVNRAVANAGQPGAGVKPSTRNAMAQTAQQALLSQERARIAAEFGYPEISPDSGEPLVDVDFSEGYPAPIYGTLPKNMLFTSYNAMRR